MALIKTYVTSEATEEKIQHLQEMKHCSASEVIRMAVKELAKKMGPDAANIRDPVTSKAGVEPNHVRSD